jgi:hypothetical protein
MGFETRHAWFGPAGGGECLQEFALMRDLGCCERGVVSDRQRWLFVVGIVNPVAVVLMVWDRASFVSR